MKPLYERYRPQGWDDLAGQPTIVKRIDVMRARGGLESKCYWITGKSGQGKTTIARLIASEVADDYAVIEIDAKKLTVDKLDQFESMCRFKPIGKGQHCFIVNESHGLSSRVVSELQTVLEESHVQRTSTWIFTTTEDGHQRLFDTRLDAMPFLSRCIQLQLVWQESVESFAERAMKIAQVEGLDGQPLQAYLDLAMDHQCNMRSMLNHIESGGMLV